MGGIKISNLGKGSAYVFGPFRLLPDECLLLRENEPVALTPQAFNLLRLLVESAGHLKTREELVEALWPTTVVEETNLSWNVRAVRKALGDTTDTPRYIETVRGRGYRFIAPVEREEPEAEDNAATPARGRSPGRHRRWPMLAAGTGIFAAAAAVVIVLAWPRLFGAGSHATRSAGSRRPAVAVLGFQNLSGDSSVDWVGTALAEMVGTDLGTGGQLRTVPPMDVARVRREFNLSAGGSALDHNVLGAISRNLDAGYVATGAYLLLGKGDSAPLRVDVRLIDAKSGTTVATLSETGNRGELFELVRSLGLGLRSHLGAAGLNHAEESEVRATIPASPAAARAYAEGLRALSDSDPVTARKALERATAIAPDFPLAYVGLAQAWMDLGDEVNARAAAEKALENSVGLARPQRLLIDGLYHEAGHEWGDAVEDYRALFTFYPDELQYGLLLARAQVKSGKPKDALETVSLMRKLPPPAGDDPRVDLAEADAADTLGDNRRAAKAAARAVTAARDRGASLLEARALSHVGRSADLLGHYKKALGYLGQAKSLYEKVGGDPSDLGIVLERIGNAYGGMGNYNAAIKAFDEANKTFVSVGNLYWQAAALNNIGNIYYQRNRLADARRYYELALPLITASHRELTSTYLLNNIAVIQGYQGDMAGAIKNYEKALAIRRAAGAKALTGDVLLNLGIDYTTMGNWQKARKDLDEAMEIFKKSDTKQDLSDVLAALADLDLEQDNVAAARKLYEESLAIRKANGMHNDAAEAERDLAELALLTGQPERAMKLAQSAVKAYQGEKAGTDEAHARAVLGLALLAEGHRADARAQLKAVEKLYPDIENVNARLKLDILVAQINAGLGDREAAMKSLGETADQAGKLGLTTLEYWARFRLAEMQAHGEMTDALRKSFEQLETSARESGHQLVARKTGLLAVRR